MNKTFRDTKLLCSQCGTEFHKPERLGKHCGRTLPNYELCEGIIQSITVEVTPETVIQCNECNRIADNPDFENRICQKFNGVKRCEGILVRQVKVVDTPNDVFNFRIPKR